MSRKEFYSVKEVAIILDLSPDRIYEYLRSGHLRGTRLTKQSAWRIPAAEIKRLTGSGFGGTGTPSESKPSKWSEYLDMALQLQDSLSHIDPRDWAIWGLFDTGQPPLTSEAGLKVWIDRGKVVVNLAVELDRRFPSFMARLKISFSEFERYDQWKESLTEFVCMCWTLAQEIWSRAENETGLILTALPVMGKGSLLNVPKFTYEFALANYRSGKQPALEIIENDPSGHRLVPTNLPDYILAMGSEAEMETCKKVTISLAEQYTKDERVNEINSKAVQLREQTVPLEAALSTLIKEATGDS